MITATRFPRFLPVGFLPLAGLIASLGAQATDSSYARVAALRGAVRITTNGASHAAKMGEDVADGAIIDCGNGAFARLDLHDGSVLNVAQGTKIKLTAAQGDRPDLWDLAKGRIRAKVEGEHGEKEKLVIRAHDVAMGIRGTDLVVSSSSEGKVSLVTVEGTVAMAVVPKGTNALEALRSGSAVTVTTGQFSSAAPGSTQPSVPTAVPAGTMHDLQKSGSSIPSFRGDGAPDSRQGSEGAGGSKQGGQGERSKDRGGAEEAPGDPPGRERQSGGGENGGGGMKQPGLGFQGVGAPPPPNSAGAPPPPGAPPPGGPQNGGPPGNQLLPPAGTAGLNPASPAAGAGGPGAPQGPQGGGKPPPTLTCANPPCQPPPPPPPPPPH